MASYPDRQLNVIEQVVKVLGGDIININKSDYRVKEVKAKIFSKVVTFKNNDFNSIPFGITIHKYVDMFINLGEKFNLLLNINKDKDSNLLISGNGSIIIKPSKDNKYEDLLYLSKEGLVNTNYEWATVREENIKDKIDKKYELNLTSMGTKYNFTLYKLKSDIEVERIIYDKYRNYEIINIIKHEPKLEDVIENKVNEFKLSLFKDKFIKDISKRKELSYDLIIELFKYYKEREESTILNELHSKYYEKVIEDLNKEYNYKD